MSNFGKLSIFVLLVCVTVCYFPTNVLKCVIFNSSDILTKLCSHSDNTGKFCSSICSSKDEECFLFHGSKELVRSISGVDGGRIIVKQKVPDVVTDEYIESLLIFDEDDSPATTFQQLLRGLLQYELEPDDNRDILALLWPWQSPSSVFEDPNWRVILAQVLRFAHSGEYALSRLHQHLHLFPRVLGTCGDVYAAQQVTPLLDSLWAEVLPALGYSCHATTSGRRILAYLRRLARTVPGGLHLCDLKWSHFGTAADGSLRFVDLDSAFSSRRMAGTQTATACTADDECDFFECRGTCDLSRGFCRPAVSDNISNLCRQLVWPRVSWLGDQRRLGLLAHLLEEEEAQLLERCALGDGENYADDVERMLSRLEQRICGELGEEKVPPEEGKKPLNRDPIE